MPSLDPDVRRAVITIASAAAREYIASLTDEERRAHTKPARDAMHQRDLDAVDPERRLPKDERERLAAERRRQRMTEMSQRAKEVRRARKEQWARVEQALREQARQAELADARAILGACK